MSGTVSTRFYFSDWQSDAGVRASSLAARGLWMEILAVAAQNKNGDHGFLLIAGRKVTMKEIARLASCAEEEIESLLAELEANGVFNRDKRGVIYCRRMVRAEKNRSNGRLGGNPNLLKSKDKQSSVKPTSKAHIPDPEPEPIESSLRSDSKPSDQKIFELGSEPRSKPKRANGSEIRTILEGLLSPEIAAGVIEHRRSLKKPLTAMAAKGLIREFAATSNPEAAARMMVERGWQGFKAAWFERDGDPQQTRAGPGKSVGRSNGTMEAFRNFVRKHGDFPDDDEKRGDGGPDENVQLLQLLR